MHPVFHFEFIGVDLPNVFIGHIIMFWSLTIRLDWSWIPLTDYEKLCGSKGDEYRAQVTLFEKTYQNS